MGIIIIIGNNKRNQALGGKDIYVCITTSQ
jgi:hypothetical protein